MKTIDELEEFTKDKPFKLSKKADTILKKINKNNGNCPCKTKETQCPCPSHEVEVEQFGRCTCGLFISIEREL
jgi:ferredoxin-thioredoxin reductase catalytic subunit